ncbi:hypothetical protein [Paenibacillus amylolyticus]|uniref:hypothetical protein n=1 Tax=Paenibacillus amylolyticus TaxID=1451 RepID=UPI003EBEF9C3
MLLKAVEGERGSEGGGIGKRERSARVWYGISPWRGNQRNPGPMSGPKADPRTERPLASNQLF